MFISSDERMVPFIVCSLPFFSWFRSHPLCISAATVLDMYGGRLCLPGALQWYFSFALRRQRTHIRLRKSSLVCKCTYFTRFFEECGISVGLEVFTMTSRNAFLSSFPRRTCLLFLHHDYTVKCSPGAVGEESSSCLLRVRNSALLQVPTLFGEQA